MNDGTEWRSRSASTLMVTDRVRMPSGEIRTVVAVSHDKTPTVPTVTVCLDGIQQPVRLLAGTQLTAQGPGGEMLLPEVVWTGVLDAEMMRIVVRRAYIDGVAHRSDRYEAYLGTVDLRVRAAQPGYDRSVTLIQNLTRRWMAERPDRVRLVGAGSTVHGAMLSARAWKAGAGFPLCHLVAARDIARKKIPLYVGMSMPQVGNGGKVGDVVLFQRFRWWQTALITHVWGDGDEYEVVTADGATALSCHALIVSGRDARLVDRESRKWTRAS